MDDKDHQLDFESWSQDQDQAQADAQDQNRALVANPGTQCATVTVSAHRSPIISRFLHEINRVSDDVDRVLRAQGISPTSALGQELAVKMACTEMGIVVDEVTPTKYKSEVKLRRLQKRQNDRDEAKRREARRKARLIEAKKQQKAVRKRKRETKKDDWLTDMMNMTVGIHDETPAPSSSSSK